MEDKKSLSEVISSVVDKKAYYSNFDSVYKAARDYLSNIFKSIGININQPMKRNYRLSKNHIIGAQLEKIITDYIKNDESFPSKEKIRKCIQGEPTQLTSEITRVIKLYLKDNFTEETYIDLRHRINDKIEQITDKLDEKIKSYNALLDEIKNNMVSLKFRAIQSLEDIRKIICEMYYILEKYSPDETTNLAEDELVIIDFIRLNKILDNIYKDIQFKHTITSLSLKK